MESHFWENYNNGCLNVVDIQCNREKQVEGSAGARNTYILREYKPLSRKENRIKQMRLIRYREKRTALSILTIAQLNKRMQADRDGRETMQIKNIEVMYSSLQPWGE